LNATSDGIVMYTGPSAYSTSIFVADVSDIPLKRVPQQL
jgi:hypothetical protein